MSSWRKFLYHIFSWPFFVLPARVRYFFGDCIGILWFDILRLRRKIVLDNIKIVFPNSTENQRVTMGRQSLFHVGRSFMEFLTLPQLDKKWAEQNVVIVDAEKVREYEKKKEGILFLSLHLGNGDMACAMLATLGYKLHLISKKFKVKWLNDYWFGVRQQMGTHFIEAHGKRTSFDILKALSKGEHVIFVLDQYMGRPEGIPTQFFGRRTGTAYGMALFHAKTKAPVIPIYTMRGEDLKTYIYFGDEIKLEDRGDRDETIRYMTEKYNRALEEIILKKPEQWMWVHRRWKTIRE
ncbi:MAG: lysophospholipid acyltransferase family protein [Pseudobdellovibrionaceae bacterium]